MFLKLFWSQNFLEKKFGRKYFMKKFIGRFFLVKSFFYRNFSLVGKICFPRKHFAMSFPRKMFGWKNNFEKLVLVQKCLVEIVLIEHFFGQVFFFGENVMIEFFSCQIFLPKMPFSSCYTKKVWFFVREFFLSKIFAYNIFGSKSFWSYMFLSKIFIRPILFCVLIEIFLVAKFFGWKLFSLGIIGFDEKFLVQHFFGQKCNFLSKIVLVCMC